MEEIILISWLNDFIFCPVSIYFHNLYGAEKLFGETDSVIIIETSETCKITKWGYAKNDENDILIVI